MGGAPKKVVDYIGGVVPGFVVDYGVSCFELHFSGNIFVRMKMSH